MENRRNLLRLTGSMQQVMNVRPVTYDEGRARGMKAYEVKTVL